MRRGMTLLELVVALVVIGLALAAGTAAFGAVLDQRTRAVEALDAASRDAAVRRTLVAWLQGARVAGEGGPPFTGLDGVERGLPDDALELLTTADAGIDAAESVVRLYIDRDTTTPERGLVAEVVEWRGLARTRVELAPAATSLDIRYLSGLRQERLWLPSWISSSVLPVGLELRLGAESPDALPALLRLPVRVALGDAR